jgi:Icc-related predicted phosphoesterase
MKCLLVSDLHYALKQLDWIDRVASRFDVVVLAGDHLDISSVVSLDAQVAVILAYVRKLSSKTALVVSSGNHDLTARDDADEKVARWLARVRPLGVSSDGDRIDVDGATITICPWWDGPRARERVAAQLERDAARRGARWVWVYHAPPDASPVSWGGQRHFGDADLLQWIERHRPDMVFTGHIHQSPFRAGGSWVDQIGSTWVFNAGRQIGPVPTHVVIDTGARHAMWFSLMTNEIVPLDRALSRPVARLLQERFESGSRSDPGECSSS